MLETTPQPAPRLDEAATEALIDRIREAWNTAETSFDAARQIARHLGGLVVEGRAEIGFWAPELLDRRVPDGDVFVEVLRPRDAISLTTARQNVVFDRWVIPAARFDAYVFAAVDGMRAGTREVIGDFYALAWRDGDGAWHRVLDPLAASLPYGAFAPGELYDLSAMQAARQDRAYYEAMRRDDGAPAKLGPVTNILQIHVPTATAGRTLASLTRHIEHIADRVARDMPLEPAERLFAAYDAIQLLPVEPTTVYEAGPAFWEEEALEDDARAVTLRTPDTTNWGYDVVIAGSAAVNPALLESARPDELVDFAAALHRFPKKPKYLIFDVVYGHADNQGLEVLNTHYFSGPNMYGQNINYRNWAVRAILLEMQRRKVDFGADGVRVDGAQDFKWWDALAEENRHDDDYLQEMADVVQEVGGTRYRPWMIFEDGRPWPQEDWELSS
ncbi:MAG: glucosylglycerol hydrolase, partial [Pseudomonadota bacterium]